jgi:hypothetical protein
MHSHYIADIGCAQSILNMIYIYTVHIRKSSIKKVLYYRYAYQRSEKEFMQFWKGILIKGVRKNLERIYAILEICIFIIYSFVI